MQCLSLWSKAVVRCALTDSKLSIKKLRTSSDTHWSVDDLWRQSRSSQTSGRPAGRRSWQLPLACSKERVQCFEHHGRQVCVFRRRNTAAEFHDLFTMRVKTKVDKQSQPLRHIVLLTFKENTPDDIVRGFEGEFSQLGSRFEEIRKLEWGRDVSVEGCDDGYTHCFIFTFGSIADRDAYIGHPEHRRWGDRIMPHLEKVLIVDFFGQL